MITAIYRKGDRTKPANDRPICFFPVLCTLFSTMLYNRLYAELDSYQFPDQAGFRQNPDNGSSHDVQSNCPKTENGELTCGWLLSIFRRLSTQHNMMQFGDLSDISPSVNNTSVS